MSVEAKVDVRKLQLLNDRINQTIDALHQVRLSVHGLSHTGPQQGWTQQGFAPQYGVNPWGGNVYGQQQYGQQISPWNQQWAQQGLIPGISHSTGINPGYGFVPGNQVNQGWPQQVGYGQQLGYGQQGPLGYGQQIVPQIQGGWGLSHTSPEGWAQSQQLQQQGIGQSLGQDPWAARLFQTFPYAQNVVPQFNF